MLKEEWEKVTIADCGSWVYASASAWCRSCLTPEGSVGKSAANHDTSVFWHPFDKAIAWLFATPRKWTMHQQCYQPLTRVAT